MRVNYVIMEYLLPSTIDIQAVDNNKDTKQMKNVNWDIKSKTALLAQLYEECRYYRKFHHTLFSIGMAGYSGLLILQANVLTGIAGKTANLGSTASVMIKGVTPFLLLFVLPCFLTYAFINWHFVQGQVRAKIISLQRILEFPQEFLESLKYEGFEKKPGNKNFALGKDIHYSLYYYGYWFLLIGQCFLLYLSWYKEWP